MRVELDKVFVTLSVAEFLDSDIICREIRHENNMPHDILVFRLIELFERFDRWASCNIAAEDHTEPWGYWGKDHLVNQVINYLSSQEWKWPVEKPGLYEKLFTRWVGDLLPLRLKDELVLLHPANETENIEDDGDVNVGIRHVYNGHVVAFLDVIESDEKWSLELCHWSLGCTFETRIQDFEFREDAIHAAHKFAEEKLGISLSTECEIE